jgi:flagellar biosynthetic protein FliR
MDWAEMEVSRLAPAYLPALARVGAVLAVTPPFAAAAMPRRVRALLALALTVGLSPVVAARSVVPQSFGQLALGIGGEVLIGLAMGLAMSLVFTAAQWAGELVTQQMGLNLAEVYDARAGGESGSPAHAYGLLAIVVFLGANGAGALVRGLGASFDAIPVMSAVRGDAIVALLTGLLQSATVLAAQLAAPVFVTLLIVDVALGMVGRTIPQLGVLTVGVTLRAGVGMCVLIAGMAVTASVLQGATVGWMQTVQSAMGGLVGK